MQCHSTESNRVAQNEIVVGRLYWLCSFTFLMNMKTSSVTVFLSLVTSRTNIWKMSRRNNEKEQFMFHCMYLHESELYGKGKQFLTASQGKNGRGGKEGFCPQNVCISLFSDITGYQCLFCPEVLKESLMPHLGKCGNYSLEQSEAKQYVSHFSFLNLSFQTMSLLGISC